MRVVRLAASVSFAALTPACHPSTSTRGRSLVDVSCDARTAGFASGGDLALPETMSFFAEGGFFGPLTASRCPLPTTGERGAAPTKERTARREEETPSVTLDTSVSALRGAGFGFLRDRKEPSVSDASSLRALDTSWSGVSFLALAVARSPSGAPCRPGSGATRP